METLETEAVGPVTLSAPRRWSIATNVVTQETATLPDFEREQLRWLQHYGLGANLTLKELAAQILQPDGTAYSQDSLYQTLTGKRIREGVNLRPLAEAIARFRRRVEEVSAKSATAFISTPQSRKLFRIFKLALEKHRLAFVFGEAQIGKTSAAAEFQRLHNHGQTHLFRLPTRGTMGDTLMEVGLRLGIPSRARVTDLRRRIIESFDENNLIIVDEAHQCLYGRYHDTTAMVLEFFREIHDRRGCGVVFMGTDVLRSGILHNKVLSQLWRRRSPGLTVQLPAMVPDEDLNVFADAFGLEPAPDKERRISFDAGGTFAANPKKLQTDIVREEGLGSWIRLLEDARDLAKETSSGMSWGRVLAAYCQAQAMEM
ncbi:MAG: AAA family ATPase [Verrucomicrobia bacterium]|nr:AAA family ATPase [Verrucomicrobiota bacterium]